MSDSTQYASAPPTNTLAIASLVLALVGLYKLNAPRNAAIAGLVVEIVFQTAVEQGFVLAATRQLQLEYRGNPQGGLKLQQLGALELIHTTKPEIFVMPEAF